MRPNDRPTPTPTTQISPSKRPIAMLLASIVALMSATSVWPSSASAHQPPEVTNLKRDLAEALEIAEEANADAREANLKAKEAQRERDDAIDQRDTYRTQRDRARTERDNLAGELAAYEAFSKRDRKLADERLVRATLAESEVKRAKKQRWIWAAVVGGAGLIVGGGVGLYVGLQAP